MTERNKSKKKRRQKIAWNLFIDMVLTGLRKKMPTQLSHNCLRLVVGSNIVFLCGTRVKATIIVQKMEKSYNS